MASNFQINISGIDDLNKEIKKETANIVGRRTRNAGKKAMQIVLDDAMRRAELIDDPDSKTSIYRNIEMETRYNKKDGTLTVSVGVRGGARYRRGDKQAGKVTYWRFIELGTSRSRAQPFLRPALQDNFNEVFHELLETMRQQFKI